MERLPSALLRKRSTLVTGPGVPGQYLAQPGLAFPLLVSKGLLLLFKHPPHPLVSRPTRPPPWMSLAWSGNPSSLPCQVLCLTPLWLRILEWASSVRSVRQKPVRSVPEVLLSQTLNLVAWRCALCLLCSQRVRRKQECVPDLSWLEGRARPSLITPQYGSPDHHAAVSVLGLHAQQMTIADVHGGMACQSQGAPQEKLWCVFLETCAVMKLLVSLWTPGFWGHTLSFGCWLSCHYL